MGGKESKHFPITYEEAVKRVNEQEKRRIQDAFRRCASTSGYMSKQSFLSSVLGEGIPPSLGEQIYQLVGGGRGVTFRDLLSLLVLLTRGTREEKVKFLYGILCGEGNSQLDRSHVQRLCGDWDEHLDPSHLASLFNEGNGDKANLEAFSHWIEKNHQRFGLASWLLSPSSNMALISHLDTPTFYQTLAGVTHLSEQEIMELEKRFWSLLGNSTSGRIDMTIIQGLVSPPFPRQLLDGLFQALDENQDGHIDFKELACGVSAACRGPDLERQKFCFKIFDQDNDGHLNVDEMRQMCENMLIVCHQTREGCEAAGKYNNHQSGSQNQPSMDNPESMLETLLNAVEARAQEPSRGLTLEDFLVWSVEESLPREFAKLVFQLCHVVLGLRPANRKEEGEIVRGWLEREEQAGFIPGQVWFLVPMSWWTAWHSYVNHSEPDSHSSLASLEVGSSKSQGSASISSSSSLGGTLGRKKMSGTLTSALASDISSRIVGTGYSPLETESRPVTPAKSSPLHATKSFSEARGSPITPRKSLSCPPTSATGAVVASGSGQQTQQQSTAQQPPARPGLIDNCGLIQSPAFRNITVLTGEGGKLKVGSGGRPLARGKDYELVPERLWTFLSHVYGCSTPLPRQVVRNQEDRVELELNPLSIKILKHQTIQRPPNVPTIVGGYNIAAIQSGIASNGYNGLVGGSGPPTVTRRYHAFQAAFSRRIAVGQIHEFLCSRLHVKHEDLRLWLYRGDENSMKLLDNENSALEDCGVKDEDSILAEIRSRDGTWPEEISSLCNEKRQLPDRQPLLPGVAGLNNLGNTCYMNAALQAVASTKILSQYFKLNCHLYELNRTNPLGMKGHIAKRFGDLVRDMWSGEMRTIAPIKLRWTIGKYEPSFASFQQQDSQELLVFLLDGLHEDLNRVTDKPYTELKDSNGRPDMEVAAEAWENHVLRNKSIIVDLFHGQLKSKVTCRVCGHESVRFDPFFNLSLPLPMERCISIEVVVILQDGSPPVKYGLAMDMEDKVSSVPTRLASVCGVPAHNLVLVDIVQSQIRVISGQDQKLRSLTGSCMFAYQISSQPEAGVVVANDDVHSPSQSITDIQRSVHSRLKVKNSNDSTTSTASEGASAGVPSSSNSLDTTSVSSTTELTSSKAEPTRKTSGTKVVREEDEDDGGPLSTGLCSSPPSSASRMDLCSNRTEETSSPVSRNSDPAGRSCGGEDASGVRERTASQTDDAIVSDSPSNHHNAISTDSGVRRSSELSEENGHRQRSQPPGRSRPHQHSRGSSGSSTLTAGTVDSERTPGITVPPDLGDHTQGIIVCLHRKMLPQEFYFLSSEKYKPTVFGIPLVINSNSLTTSQDIYSSVWEQVARLVSPLPPQDAATQANHATDCDDSLGYEYPFVLKGVRSGGSWCAWCPWTRLCRGCPIPCNATKPQQGASFYAIDWDPTALHLRYLAGAERAWVEHGSVAASRKAATEPITLNKCLEAFTQEEELGEKEKYYCSACKTHQMIVKKLQIWRLPPVLIVHLKRFQNVNDRWIKSHKIVDFPLSGLDLTEYLAAVPAATLRRYKELVSQGKWPRNNNIYTNNRSSRLSTYSANKIYSTITEAGEGQAIQPTSRQDPTAAANATEVGEDVVSKLESLGSQLNDGNNGDKCAEDEVVLRRKTSPRVGLTSERSHQSSTPNGSVSSSAAASSSQPSSSGMSDDDPNNDSGIESNGGGAHNSLERGSSVQSGDAVFDCPPKANGCAGGAIKATSNTSQNRSAYRTRQISTSLAQDPVIDDNLKDFHGHLLEPGRQPLDIKYNMYAMVCHSGVLGGGHYVSYSRQKTGSENTWYCHNDSTCKAVPESSIDKSTAYILMYEREGLSMTDYLPNTTGLKMDTGAIDEEFDIDFKKQCSLM